MTDKRNAVEEARALLEMGATMVDAGTVRRLLLAVDSRGLDKPVFQRFEYSVLEVAAELAGIVKGTHGGGLPPQEYEDRARWLAWRLETWQLDTMPQPWRAYESAVRLLAQEAMALWKSAE